MGGYSGHLGVNFALYVELQSIKHGLMQGWEKSYRKLWCESESLHALRLITTTQSLQFHLYAGVVEDIKALVGCDW